MLKLGAGPYMPDHAAITGGPNSAKASATAVGSGNWMRATVSGPAYRAIVSRGPVDAHQMACYPARRRSHPTPDQGRGHRVQRRFDASKVGGLTDRA